MPTLHNFFSKSKSKSVEVSKKQATAILDDLKSDVLSDNAYVKQFNKYINTLKLCIDIYKENKTTSKQKLNAQIIEQIELIEKELQVCKSKEFYKDLTLKLAHHNKIKELLKEDNLDNKEIVRLLKQVLKKWQKYNNSLLSNLPRVDSIYKKYHSLQRLRLERSSKEQWLEKCQQEVVRLKSEGKTGVEYKKAVKSVNEAENFLAAIQKKEILRDELVEKKSVRQDLGKYKNARNSIDEAIRAYKETVESNGMIYNEIIQIVEQGMNKSSVLLSL